MPGEAGQPQSHAGTRLGLPTVNLPAASSPVRENPTLRPTFIIHPGAQRLRQPAAARVSS